MGSITNYLEEELLDHVCNGSFTSPSAVYVALCTADPGEAATDLASVECADANNYAREAISFGVAASRSVQQSGAVTFNQASGSWGTVSHWALSDALARGTGNCLAYGAFNESKAIVSGNTPSIADSEIDVTFSANEVSDYLALELLDHAFNNAAYTQPATWIALCTSTVSDSDTTLAGKECADSGSYARKQVNANGGAAPDWNLVSSSLVDNNDEIAFTTATGDWGTVVAVAVCDNGTHNGGNMLMYDNAMSDQAVGNGDTAKFPAGTLDLTLE